VEVSWVCVGKGAECQFRSSQLGGNDDMDDDDDLRNNSLHLRDTQNEVVLLGRRFFLLL